MKSILTPYEVIRSNDPQACLKIADIKGCCINDVIRACWQYYYSENKRLHIQEEKYSQAIATMTQRTNPKAPGFEELRNDLRVLRDDVNLSIEHFAETFDQFAKQYPRPPVEDKKRTPTSILNDAYRMAEHHPKPTTKRKEPKVGGIFADDYEEHPQPIPPDFTFPTTELAEEYLRQS